MHQSKERNKELLCCDNNCLIDNAERRDEDIEYRDKEDADDRPVVSLVSLAHLLVFLDVVNTIPYETNTHGDL